ncbi:MULTISPECIES: chemotaxis protein CheC [Pontibacillus]|uniref:Chemotaxis protein CheC n=1 Tax=Pontibacillus chungwhensis TaxID=265426 RepID=A0ABY8V2F7_9BACI|nr:MULTISPECIES: chemotaxis protein CheC [Pontibacillus]MCD5322706.1 chemotaxis protein CheC [Pontibacillus sp. HN14]WIF99982.1 chemotaxis protein CheC [Pontibacillus chungwhensis]
MKFEEQFTSYHLDVLKEIGNIGAGNAATSLSKLLQRKIDMKVPSVRVVGFDEVMDIVGGAERTIVSVFLRIEGDAPGNMFFIMSPGQASRFVRHMTGEQEFDFNAPPYSELSLSSVQELGNILSGSYLSSMSDFTQLSLYPSVPSIAIDMVGAVLSFGLLELSQVSDYAIVIDTTFVDEEYQEEEVKGHFFLLPDPASFETIFASLGVSSNES